MDSQSAIPAEFREYFSLALAEDQRYQDTDQSDALDAAINAWERILTDASFPETPETFQLKVFNRASTAYLKRYRAKEELTDLDRPLTLLQQTIAASPPESPEQAGYLSNLGNDLHARYLRTSQLADLAAAITACGQTAKGGTPKSREQATYLNNLNSALNERTAELTPENWVKLCALLVPHALLVSSPLLGHIVTYCFSDNPGLSVPLTPGRVMVCPVDPDHHHRFQHQAGEILHCPMHQVLLIPLPDERNT